MSNDDFKPDRIWEHDFPGTSPTRRRRYRSRSRSSNSSARNSGRSASPDRRQNETPAQSEREQAQDSRPRSIDDLFPYESYRPHQREILEEASACLFEQDYETVIIGSPTGIGKSGINVALARAASRAFITTPQKKLRRQLEEDADLRGFDSVLRARADYSCFNGYTCKDCPVNTNSEYSCSSIPQVPPDTAQFVLSRYPSGEPERWVDYPPAAAQMDSCTYWSNKLRAMKAARTVLTPGYLVVDYNLPDPVSFGNRELLVVDEAHTLVDQTANLWAGFSISPDSVPEDVYDTISDDIDETTWSFSTIAPLLDRVLAESRRYIDSWREPLQEARAAPGSLSERDKRISEHIDQCDRVIDHIERAQTDVSNGRGWVGAVEPHRGNPAVPRLELTPVDVDEFLADRIWSRADKQVLSTATMPYRDDPTRWLDELGLAAETTHVIRKPMPFAPETRPVDRSELIGVFSDEQDYETYWDEIVATIERLATRHAGEKGLIHTHSYPRATKLSESLDVPTVLHEQDSRSDQWYLNQWQDPSVDGEILLSPVLTDGVDLPDDQCRWQVLAKVPYGQGPRWDYKRIIDGDWQWYYDRTARTIIQSVGRAVRHDEDYCRYYVVDASFDGVFASELTPHWKDVATMPDWFQEAVQGW